MKNTVLTLFPEMYEGFLKASIIKRIIEKGLAEVKVVNIRDYSLDKHHHVDDTPYGGGAGMLMKVDVVHRALLDNISNDYTYTLLTSPKARPLKQEDLIRLSKLDEFVIICGHYEGIDHRIEKYVDEKISIGDYILTGGELPSMVVIDGILRLLRKASRPIHWSRNRSMTDFWNIPNTPDPSNTTAIESRKSCRTAITKRSAVTI